MKRVITVVAVALLLTGLLSVPAFASSFGGHWPDSRSMLMGTGNVNG